MLRQWRRALLLVGEAHARHGLPRRALVERRDDDLHDLASLDCTSVGRDLFVDGGLREAQMLLLLRSPLGHRLRCNFLILDVHLLIRGLLQPPHLLHIYGAVDGVLRSVVRTTY